jgi:hypothetical protein
MKLFFRFHVGFTLYPAILLLLATCQFLIFATDSFGISLNQQLNFEKTIIDYRQHLNPLFEKTKRICTRYIIVHTSECDLQTTLKIVSKVCDIANYGTIFKKNRVTLYLLSGF